jgi:integrase
MKKDLKNLKAFVGNDLAADWALKPVDRTKSVDDIPSLDIQGVNVVGYVGKNVRATGERRTAVKLCRLDKVPDKNQFDFLYKLLQDKRRASAKKPEKIGVERTLNELIDKFLVDVAWEFKDFNSYRQRCGYWKNKIGKLTIEEVTTGLIKEHKYLLKKNGPHGRTKLKPVTVNRYVECLQRAFRFAIDIGWANDCPISNKKVPKDPETKRVRWLDDDELHRLFSGLELTTSKNLKDMVHFALNTGCRISEALGLRWKDIDFKNNRLHFRVVKRNSQCRKAYFNKKGVAVFEVQPVVFEEGLKNGDDVKVLKLDNMPQLRTLLLKRREKSGSIFNSEHVFPNNVIRSWYSLLKRAEIDNFHWHDLRHCCASYMRQDGKSLGIIGSHLGHKDSASTARYSHLSGEETLETGASISKKLYG